MLADAAESGKDPSHISKQLDELLKLVAEAKGEIENISKLCVGTPSPKVAETILINAMGVADVYRLILAIEVSESSSNKIAKIMAQGEEAAAEKYITGRILFPYTHHQKKRDELIEDYVKSQG